MDNQSKKRKLEEASRQPNDSMFQKFMEIIMKKTPDVHFIFEEDNDTVKLPAHKDVLAASSKVFDAMFNGELKEEGDVNIVDASSAAFKEFLQLFYEHQVALSMENVAEVLKLIDKYDVTNCFPICADFLKENLTTDNILWGLHLAIKYGFDELKTHCKNEIQKNYKEVASQLTFDDNGKLIESSDNRLLEIDLGNILPHVFMALKNVIQNIPDQLQTKRVIYSALSSEVATSLCPLNRSLVSLRAIPKLFTKQR